MKVSVDLQEPISYMSLWMVIAVALVLIIIAAQIIFRVQFKGRLRKPKKPKIKKVPLKTLEEIKSKYIKVLYNIEISARNSQTSVRESYQRVSGCIRDFVFEATGIPVDKYSLSEIRKLKMPILTQLVTEYYEPEFARETYSDIFSSIFKTRRVLESWR